MSKYTQQLSVHVITNVITIEVWEWMINFRLHFVMDLIIHPFFD